MTDQITVPRETWDATLEALQQAIGALEISGIYARRQADEFKPKSLADSIHKRDLQGIATGIATALATCRTADNAVQPQAQGEAEKLMRGCFELLELFSYENDEDSQSKAFFKAHINVDWFFYVKNSIERQLKAEAKK